MKIIHVITGLNNGGAEAVLYRLCKYDRTNIHQVISLSGLGKYSALFKTLGIKVTALCMSPVFPSVQSFLRLHELLRKEKPDIVQTWMYHADLVGGLAARAAGIRSVVWGIHNTALEYGKSKIATIWIAKLLAKLSPWLPAKIVVCAKRAIGAHGKLGYEFSKMQFIPNGYDLADFKPMSDSQNKFKESLNAKGSIPIIGNVSRYDPYKDHANLFQALEILNKRGIKFHCLLIGAGIDHNNKKIKEWVAKHGLSTCVKLLGQRNDIPIIMNSLDLHVLSSSSEAFPNVVAEAMACGTPCVVTDVGDAAYIVGDTGWVVPPQNANALAETIAAALKDLSATPKKSERSARARRRIEELFSIERMVSSYSAIWSEVINK